MYINKHMKKSIFSLFFCFASLGLNAQKYEDIQPFDLKPLEIECSITCEIPDLDLFEISWTVPRIDSIAKAEGQLPSTELHCFVYDSSGMIGYYTGLSAPMQHCDFQTKDSIVEVFFRWRRIPYAYYNQDSVEIMVSSLELSPFNKTSYRGSEFESIHLPLYSTTNRKLTLLNDTNTVRISSGTHSRDRYDPLGHPYANVALGYSGVITLDRYYLSLKTGRIATGQKWINRKGIRKIAQKGDQYVLVSPSMQYVDKNNNQYSGAELVKARRIKLEKFDLNQFKKTDKENIPY
jgi:hypothetical protein